MIRFVTVWYDKVQGVWKGVVGTIWYDTIRYDTIRYDTIRYDTQYNTIQYTLLSSLEICLGLKCCAHIAVSRWRKSSTYYTNKHKQNELDILHILHPVKLRTIYSTILAASSSIIQNIIRTNKWATQTTHFCKDCLFVISFCRKQSYLK